MRKIKFNQTLINQLKFKMLFFQDCNYKFENKIITFIVLA